MPLKKYYRANREKYRAMYKNSYHANKDIYYAYCKKFRATADGKRCVTVNNWKGKGMLLYEGEDWTTMYNNFLKQEFCCGCGVSFDERRKALDHDHDTGFVRGILCYSCNRLDVLANL